MTLVLIQFVLATAACALLWWCWRDIASYGWRAGLIAGMGLLIRAAVSELLFWVSYLRLPLGRSLQLARGFWFYAPDSVGYYHYSLRLARKGLWRALMSNNIFTSRIYIKTLTSSLAAFGSPPSVSILVNCLAFILACLCIVRIGARNHTAHTAGLIALAAVSFAPSSIIWSTQPLKDTIFVCFIAVAIYLGYRFQQLATSGGAWYRIAAVLTCLVVVTFLMAGIRWYYALILSGAYVVLFILTIIRAREKMIVAVFSLLTVLWLPQAVLWGGRTDVPPFFVQLLSVRTFVPSLITLPASLSEYMGTVSSGYDATGGNTQILAGPTMARVSPAPVIEARSPRVSTAAGPEQVPPRAATATETGSAQTSTAVGQAQVSRRSATGRRRNHPRPAPVHRKRTGVLPQSRAARLFTGFVAAFLPRAIGTGLGLVEIGGGRGMWLVADIDTLAFDAIIISAIGYTIYLLRRRRATITPLFVFLILLCATLSVPLIYTVNNFGTLFRQRQMIYLEICLLPAALAARGDAETIEPDSPVVEG